MDTFAERLRHARKSRHLSQAQLAQTANLSQSAISSYETRLRASSRGIIKLAAALRVNLLWLSDGIGPMELTVPKGFEDPKPSEQGNHGQQWPFVNVLPSVYFGLSNEQKVIIEDMILAFYRRNMNST